MLPTQAATCQRQVAGDQLRRSDTQTGSESVRNQSAATAIIALPEHLQWCNGGDKGSGWLDGRSKTEKLEKKKKENVTHPTEKACNPDSLASAQKQVYYNQNPRGPTFEKSRFRVMMVIVRPLSSSWAGLFEI